MQNVSDWFAQGNPIETVLWVAYVFIIAATGIVGGYASGLIGRGAALLVFKDLSRAWVFRIRVLGGLAGALAAYMLLSPGDLGIGRGPGPGGLTSDGTTEQGEDLAKQPLLDRTNPAIKPGSSAERTGNAAVLRVTLLGDGTNPPWQPRNRFFALADAPTQEALDVEGVMHHLDEMRKTGNVKEVDLVVSPQSTSLQNLEVQRLRRAVQQAGLRFYAPDPENP